MRVEEYIKEEAARWAACLVERAERGEDAFNTEYKKFMEWQTKQLGFNMQTPPMPGHSLRLIKMVVDEAKGI